MTSFDYLLFPYYFSLNRHKDLEKGRLLYVNRQDMLYPYSIRVYVYFQDYYKKIIVNFRVFVNSLTLLFSTFLFIFYND